MAYVSTKGIYHVALNGVGMILQGAPERPAYAQTQAPVYGTRFASGDRTYNDLSKWWYFAQTDWSGGFKDTVAWEDDAKHYYATNIDAFSEPGSIKLMSDTALENDFTEEISCGTYDAPGSTVYPYVGTNLSGGATKPAIYRKSGGSWSNISSAFMPTTQQTVMDVMGHKNKLWFITMDKTSGGTYEVGYCVDDGSTPVDLSANVSASPRHVYAMDSDGQTMYIAYRGQSGSQGARIDKSTDNGATFSNIVNYAGGTDGARIVCVRIIGGDLYYLVTKASGVELRKYDGSADALVWFWPGAELGNSKYSVLGDNDQSAVRGASMSRKGIQYLNGKVVITLQYEIWEYNDAAGTMNRIYKKDTTKAAIDFHAYGYTLEPNFISLGATLHDNKLWWGNLMYDGVAFFNTKRTAADSDSNYSNPLFSNGSVLYWIETTDFTKLYVDSGYKGTADKNYIVFSNFDKLSGIDKLIYSATILFKPLASGQKIIIEYFTGELVSGSTWTELGRVDFAVDAGVVRDKTFFFPVGTTFKKIWFRVKMVGGGSDTPTMTDFISTYLPIPSPSKLWNLNVNCGDNIQTLAGRMAEKTGREQRALLESAWWTKSVLDYQDLDYATTLIDDADDITATDTTITVDSTVDFPEQGRLRIDDEEVFYTGKTPTSFTGCVRGARDTRAAAHSNNAVVNNAYKVIITNLEGRLPVMNKDKQLEYIVSISLREA